MAVEVHQSAVGGTDMTFGSALSYSRPSGAQGAPTLNIIRSGAKAVLSWTGSGFALQQATAPTGTWTFVSGPATAGPYTNTLSGPASFFRLRN